jgi:2Fe-2S ferredoxin
MGGSNPYIEKAETEIATQAFTVTFKGPHDTKEVSVDPEKIPYGPTGLPGSLLDIAMGAGIDLEHACGGVCACSTCHVIVKEGLETCNESTEDEDDQLDEAPGITLQSRLACQCVSNGTKNLVVEIPEWNKNLVKEDPH